MTEKSEAQQVFEQALSEGDQERLVKIESWRQIGISLIDVIAGLEQAGFPTAQAQRIGIIAVIEIGRGGEETERGEDQ